MKHKAFRWIPAVLLAALLAGCGARAAASARPAGSRELKSTPPDSMHWMLMRRLYAPFRSPTSFSYGGGFWKGSTRMISMSALAFSSRWADFSFGTSFAAVLV